MLRIFGSKAYKLIDTNRSKFSKKSLATILVGYEPGQKAYRLWEPGTRKIHISRDVEIDELQPKQVTTYLLPEEDEEGKLKVKKEAK